MSKLVIGCGYLGRRVAAAWLREGHEVIALTRSTANAEDLSRLGIRPVVGDICEPTTLAGLPAAEAVLFAVGFDRTSGRSQREVYVDGLRHVLNQVASRCGRFLYVSSSSVYGQSAGEWVDETSLCDPVQPGGQCCLAAEAVVHEYFPSTKPFANVLRLSGIYGPGRLLSRIDSLRAGEPLSGRGEAWLNLIHVDDAVAAVLACERCGQPGETYLISDGQPLRREEYYGQLARLVSAPLPAFSEDQPARRGSGGLNKRCSNRKAGTDLGLVFTYANVTAGLPHALGLTSESATPVGATAPPRTLPAE